MSLYDYRRALALADEPFYALIMAAMSRADDSNLARLQSLWPDVWEEWHARYWAPDCLLSDERPDAPERAS